MLDRKKRGMNQVISILIIIAGIFVISAGILYWVQTTASKAQQDSTAKQMCSEVDFTSAGFCRESLNIQNIETGGIEEKERIIFGVRNDKNVPIEGFLISLTDSAGNSFTISTLMGSDIDVNNVKQVTSDFINNSENLDKIEILPKIKINNKVFICEETKKISEWGEIIQC